MVRPKFVEKAVNSLANSASGLYNKVNLWLSKGTLYDSHICAIIPFFCPEGAYIPVACGKKWLHSYHTASKPQKMIVSFVPRL